MVLTRLEHNDFMLRESPVKTDRTFEEFLEFESHSQERHEDFSDHEICEVANRFLLMRS
jgi:hypothetical protein